MLQPGYLYTDSFITKYYEQFTVRITCLELISFYYTTAITKKYIPTPSPLTLFLLSQLGTLIESLAFTPDFPRYSKYYGGRSIDGLMGRPSVCERFNVGVTKRVNLLVSHFKIIQERR